VRLQSTGAVHVYRVGGSARHWSADGRHLLILDDKSGAENHHLFRLDVEDPNARPVDLTPHPGVRVWVHQIPKSDPEHVLVLHNRRNPTERDLYRINLTTGAEEVVALNPGDGIVPVTDADGKFLGWRKPAKPERARGKPLPPELREQSALSKRTPELTRPVGVSADRTQAWILSNRQRDRVALFHADAVKKKLVLVHEDPNVDVARVVMSEVSGMPLLVASNADYPRTKILDARLEADLQPLLASYGAAPHGFDIVSMDPSERRLVVVVFTHASRRYYLIDRETKEVARLGESRGANFGEAMAVPEPVTIPARDGLDLPAYLLRPRGTRDQPLPLVILVHGGPWGRVAWGDPDDSEDMLRAQFLANRGYAVLIVNYRGSTGYGRGFMSAAVGEFGAAMQDDLVDALGWAVERGIADPGKVAVMGHSYGGYATVMALAQHPRTFACGVDIAGPTDLVQLLEEFPPYWELAYWYSYVGDPAVASDRERMQRVSPVSIADRIEAPLLIVQGRQDVRVPEAQSAALVERLRQHGKPFEYRLLDDMGHSTGWWAHHLFVLRRTEEFLARCLGGRAARFDRMEWIARLTGRLPLW
jgi:dipeptidyl aminopeptidase/acylaminoacyl peptidase